MTLEYAVVMPVAGPPRLRWADLAPGGEAVHHAEVAPGEAKTGLHRHDFLEFFWVAAGRGEEVGGPGSRGGRGEEAHRLRPGGYACVTEDDAHAFAHGAGLRLRNVAFPRAAYGRLRGRYPGLPDRFARGWGDRRGVLGVGGVQRLEAAAAGLAAGRRDAAALDGFLLQLDCVLGSAAGRASGPAWLHQALAAPERWRAGGVPALVATCGFGREHVARACRAHLGRTPTQLVAAARVEHAARCLAGGDAAVSEVGRAAGFGDAGSFHAAFRERFGTTPARYRRAHRRVVPPEAVGPTET